MNQGLRNNKAVMNHTRGYKSFTTEESCHGDFVMKDYR